VNVTDTPTSAHLPALTTLSNALQSAVSIQFSAENRFLRALCREDAVVQSSHQINYVKGLIGDQVGLSEGTKFDINAQVINQHLLGISRQETLETYYSHMDLNNVIALVKGSFDSQIKTQDKAGRTALYGSLRKINEAMKLDERSDHIGLWIEENEETFAIEEISTRGVIRVMQHAGLLDLLETH
jgi:hypothetical protein